MARRLGRWCAWLAALSLLAALVPPARSQAGTSVPFKARVTGLAVGNPCGTYTAEGNAAHLGAITESGSYCVVEVLGPGLLRLTGEGTQVAANGDTLSFTFDEVVNLTTEPFTGEATFVITGGTGRFEGATGGGTFSTTGTVAGDTFSLDIEYEGTISY